MTGIQWLIDQRIRKWDQESADNLRGSMENSGQEKQGVGSIVFGPGSDITTFEQIKDGMAAAMKAMKAESVLVRNAALEEAAKVCDDLDDFSPSCEAIAARKLGKLVRALKRE